MDEKCSRGRLREKMTEGMVQCFHSENMAGMLTTTKEKDLWRDMIANTARHTW